MSELVLSARDLVKHYRVSRGWLRGNASVAALNGVSFDLKKGCTLAVVGESGCGKSTLARQLTMIESPTSGELTLDGTPVHNLSRKALKPLRCKIQMVFQNPYASLNPRQKIGAQLSEPLLVQKLYNRAERTERVREMMSKVGLRSEYFYRYPHMFSGGQRQRIAIARAMMLNPQIIVADEPTSALDVSIQAQVLNLFMDLQLEFGTTYVFISHNLSVVEHMADQVMVMYLGKVVELADKQSLYQRPLHPYTRVLLSATPSITPERRRIQIKVAGELPSPLHLPGGCAFHKRCPYAAERCRTDIPPLREIDGHQVACHRVEEIGF